MFDDEFYPPPEAPVFEPNEEEFADPLGYIAKIRPIAEKAGICKVRPPPYWQPPFAIDVENFKFVPRIQRLNELGIQTRIRLQFIQQVAKFWELQGTPFRLPHIAGRPMDLYGLHRAVKKIGGFEEVCRNRQWNAICPKLGLAKNFSATLKQHYEKLLYPYDIMRSGVLLESLDGTGKPVPPHLSGRYGSSTKSKVGTDEQTSEDTEDTLKMKMKRRAIEEPMLVDVSNNKELAKLQLFGAGPKMLGLGLIAKRKNRLKSSETSPPATSDGSNGVKTEPPPQVKTEPGGDCKNIFDLMEMENKTEPPAKIDTNSSSTSEDSHKKISTRKKGSEQIPYSMLDSFDNCKICVKDHNEAQLLLCDGCDDSYHTYCLIPPLQNIPKGDWRCPKCLAKECNKKTDAYGFEQARKEYTLQTFGEMADAFKSEYFTKPAHMIPTELVEKEFWRLIGSLEEDLTVEYGADIHVLDHGSGFPRMCDKEKHPLSNEEEEYATSGWNLNNLPVAKQSLLNCMSGDISGMKVPWVYVGMCFSAFCWHIEDHWTYSINYLHWGEPKTWYGVPREDATKLEKVMQNTAPDLFKQHPDVLHHLVTTINPATLMKNGVRVVRTNQCAGEFVITFPRAYHAGFNTGYNFAEAVNFCPADWVPIGRQSVAHYRAVSRPCVFSHEEIMCKVANDPEQLDVQLAAAVYRDMIVMIKEETEARQRLLELGVVKEEREAFELVPDDERQCCICKTTCFLSAIACECQPERFVCVNHINKLCDICSPSQYVLHYRYTLDELPPMLRKVKIRAESFDTWSTKLEDTFSRKENKVTLVELKDLLDEAIKQKFPENEKLHQLQCAIREAEKCSKLAQQLITVRKHRTRQKEQISATGVVSHPSGCLLTLSEIRAFHKQLLGLPCCVPNLEQVSEFIKKVENFVAQTENILQEEEPSSKNIEVLIEDSLDFDLDLPQVPLLHHALKQAKWLEDVRSCLMLDDELGESSSDQNLVSLAELRKLIDSGVSVAPRRAVEQAMAELQELLNLSEAWEEKAKTFIESKEKGSLKSAEVITSESQNVPVHLPYCSQLYDMVEKANSWTTKLQTIQGQDYYPYLEVLEALLLQARPMGIKLPSLPILTTQVEAAQEWKERTSRAFLKKNSLFSLLEVLTPRSQERKIINNLKAMRRKIKDFQLERQQMIEKWAKTDVFDVKNPADPAQVVAKFKNLEKDEMITIKEMRFQNNGKSTASPIPDNDQTMKDVSLDIDIYCVCRKPSLGFMLQCELCRDWFHTSCVPPIRFNKEKSLVQQVYELKFLCPLCHRSRRPRLEIILSLLLQLQKLPVRIKEGEALQCLTERAMGWQDRARDLLKEPKYDSIIRQLDKKLKENEKLWQEQEKRRRNQFETDSSTLDGRGSPKPALISSKRLSSLESIDSTIDNVLRRTSVQDQQRSVDSSGVDALLSAASKSEAEQEDVMEAAEVLAMLCGSGQTQRLKQDDPELKAVITRTADPSQETTVKKETDGIELKDECIREKKESHSLSRGPLINLPEDMRVELEELMMEGDLLEVTLDETQQIWKILQASQPISDEKFQELCEVEQNQGFRGSTDKDSERKRKKKEEQSIGGMGEKRKKHRSSSDVFTSSKDVKRGEGSRKKRGGMKQSALDALVAFDDDEYAICAISDATSGLVTCKQPTGEEVDWLQCDGGCEAWFHCVCVSVTAEEARNLDYVCEKCTSAKTLCMSNGGKANSPLQRQNSDGSSGMEVDVTNSTPSMSPAPIPV
uniref:[histone H3]-trimethyl-L-lysine(4) demethylase n=1 Tax=Polyandrocarpa misakiensis TaxID=7723 RepID=A0A3T1CWC7_POLMI|nr:lysine demethylase 5 [Polyandrocarpa misakiensis]